MLLQWSKLSQKRLAIDASTALPFRSRTCLKYKRIESTFLQLDISRILDGKLLPHGGTQLAIQSYGSFTVISQFTLPRYLTFPRWFFHGNEAYSKGQCSQKWKPWFHLEFFKVSKQAYLKSKGFEIAKVQQGGQSWFIQQMDRCWAAKRFSDLKEAFRISVNQIHFSLSFLDLFVCILVDFLYWAPFSILKVQLSQMDVYRDEQKR